MIYGVKPYTLFTNVEHSTITYIIIKQQNTAGAAF